MTLPELQAALDRDPAAQRALSTLHAGLAAPGPGRRGSQGLDNPDASGTANAFSQFGIDIKQSPLLGQIPAGYFLNPMTGQIEKEAPDHSLRNTLLAAGGIVALGGLSALVGGAGAAAGAAGTGAEAAGTGAAAATLPSTVIGTGFIPGIAGGTGLAGAGGAAAAAGAGGTLEGLGAGGGVGSTTIPAGTLPSTTIGSGFVPAVGHGASGLVPAAFAGGAGGGGGGAASAFSYGDALRYGVPLAGNVISSLIQANAAGKASDAQQKYLEEALAYQKEQDAYARKLGETRYADFEGRIAPFIATGTSANARMAALLGLSPTAAPATATPPAAPATAPPTPMVRLQAPDGSMQDVPADQRDHYLQRGARMV